MQDNLSEEVSLKKDLYVQLAFALYGHIVTKDSPGGVVSRSAAFTVTPEGKFFLLLNISDSIEPLLTDKEMLFVILKEGASVADMWDIQVKGTLSLVPNTDKENLSLAKRLFEDKSPYLGMVAFLDIEKEYRLFQLSPTDIFFQNLGKQREGKPSYSLVKS